MAALAEFYVDRGLYRITFMRIELELEPWDLADPNDIDPLGRVTVSAGETGWSISDCYLDEWLDAFVEGFEMLKTEDDAIISMTCEGNALWFKKTPSGITIEFGDASMTVSNMEELDSAIKEALKIDLRRPEPTPDKSKDLVG